jgi:TolB protein
VAQDSDGWGVYSVSASGGEPKALQDSAGKEVAGSWSPDGSEIVFYSDAAGSQDIWIIDADGSNARRFTHHQSAHEVQPSWFGVRDPEAGTPSCGA